MCGCQCDAYLRQSGGRVHIAIRMRPTSIDLIGMANSQRVRLNGISSGGFGVAATSIVDSFRRESALRRCRIGDTNVGRVPTVVERARVPDGVCVRR